MPYGWKVAAAAEALPPVLSKLYRESALRPAAPQAAVSPATARRCGVARGRRARLVTSGGSLEVEVVEDLAVMPGVVHLATGPDPGCLGESTSGGASPVDACVVEGSITWRVAGATLAEA
jgi:anaerobic selenocysteine-containing dehydrogenase